MFYNKCSHPCADAPCWRVLCFFNRTGIRHHRHPHVRCPGWKEQFALTYMNTRNCESISFQSTRIRENLGQIVDTYYLPFIEWLMDTLKLRNNGSRRWTDSLTAPWTGEGARNRLLQRSMSHLSNPFPLRRCNSVEIWHFSYENHLSVDDLPVKHGGFPWLW